MVSQAPVFSLWYTLNTNDHIRQEGPPGCGDEAQKILDGILEQIVNGWQKRHLEEKDDRVQQAVPLQHSVLQQQQQQADNDE